MTIIIKAIGVQSQKGDITMNFVKILSFFSGSQNALETTEKEISKIFTDTVIPFILFGGGFICIAVLIVIGIKWSTAQTPEQAQAQKKRLLSWVVGTGIMFTAACIYEIVKNFFLGVAESIDPNTNAFILKSICLLLNF